QEQNEDLEEQMDQCHRMTDKESEGEAITHDQQEHGDQHIGDRRGKEGLFFLDQQRQKSPHAAASLGRWVSCKKMRSRSGRTVVSSDSPSPRPTRAAANCGATSGCGSASTR